MKKATKQLLENKKNAMKYFIDNIVAGKAGSNIAKIYLFGSLVKDDVSKESDIDLFIIGLNSLEILEREIDKIMFDTMMKYDEIVQPIIGCINELDFGDSYFHNVVIKDRKEVYSMPDDKIKAGQAREFFELADQYFRESEPNLKLGNYRILVDGSYNTIELCLKGLLILEGKTIPKRHGNIIQQFSRLYIKTGKLPRELGRKLTKALRWRNRARYERHAIVTKETAESMLELAKELLTVLEDELI